MSCAFFGLALTALAADEPTKEAGKPMATKLATFGGGCFWCTEAVFNELAGVEKVESGYSGGHVPDPTYEQVSSGDTGHAEVIQISYDPSKVSYEKLLEVFFKTHDPTTLNRQGADKGTQYRSVIFSHDEDQKKVAEAVRAKLDASGAYDNKIVTQVAKYDAFYKAEEGHQSYYARNPRYGYCTAVIQPKLEKFRKVFEKDLKAKQADPR